MRESRRAIIKSMLQSSIKTTVRLQSYNVKTVQLTQKFPTGSLKQSSALSIKVRDRIRLRVRANLRIRVGNICDCADNIFDETFCIINL